LGEEKTNAEINNILTEFGDGKVIPYPGFRVCPLFIIKVNNIIHRNS
jgi:hypothetical protein